MLNARFKYMTLALLIFFSATQVFAETATCKSKKNSAQVLNFICCNLPANVHVGLNLDDKWFNTNNFPACPSGSTPSVNCSKFSPIYYSALDKDTIFGLHKSCKLFSVRITTKP